jgi:hypothetical protein
MSEIKLNPTTDYSRKIYSGPSYRVSKVVPISSGQTLSIPQSSTANIQFELPAAVLNLAKSKLYFDISVPLVSSAYSWIYADPLALIDRIQLSTRSGTSLIDIQGVNNFSAVVSPIMTSNTELYQRSVGGLTHAGVIPITVNGTIATDSQQCPLQGLQIFNGLQSANYRYDDATAASSTAEVAYSEQRYLFGSLISTIQCQSYQLNLDLVKHSILAINKDLFFNENIILSITFAPSNKFTWTTTSAFPAGTAILANPTSISVSNLSLYLMIETNAAIIEGLRQKVLSPEGFSLLCPFVYSQKVNSGTNSSSSSIFQRFNRGHGRSILRTYWSLFNGSETLNTALDRTNVANAKVSSYRSTINNMNIQEFPIDCSRSEEWLLNSDILDGSAVLSIDQFKYLFTHTDDFTSMRPLYLADDTMECGKALDQEITYGVYCNTVSSGSSYNHYLFTIVQRELKIVAGQIGWN